MKKLLLFVVACISSASIKAQEQTGDFVVFANEDSCVTGSIQSAIDACLLLAKSAESGEVAALREAKDAMKECNFNYFGALENINRSENNVSLCGHLIFNTAFADSLLNRKDAYYNADYINRTSVSRGQMHPGEILSKTCFIKAGGKSVYTFSSRNRQELAVVSEPGGLISIRIHAINEKEGINEWHNDTIDVVKGRNSRKAAFTLPRKSNTQITLEISNCTQKDITVVVISN